MSSRKFSVCFVCLGNICRSPTAEGVFARLVANERLRGIIKVDSAGLGAWHKGERADKRARTVAEKHGYELNSVARQITEADFETFDMLIAMDRSNAQELRTMAKGGVQEAKISLLRDHDPISPNGTEVPDPYYGSAEDFELMFGLVERACKALLADLQRKYQFDPLQPL